MFLLVETIRNNGWFMGNTVTQNLWREICFSWKTTHKSKETYFYGCIKMFLLVETIRNNGRFMGTTVTQNLWREFCFSWKTTQKSKEIYFYGELSTGYWGCLRLKYPKKESHMGEGKHTAASEVLRTSSSAVRKRTTHLDCGSCKRKLDHVQTCLSTRVCLTDHPSDTPRLFLELNCRTMYINTLKLHTPHPVLVIAYNKKVKTRVAFNTETSLGRFGMW